MSVTVKTNITNGVSYGLRHVITAAEASDGTIIFDFQNSVDLVATIMVTTTAGVVLVIDGMVVTYPADGQVQISGSGNYTVTATDIIHLIANKMRDD
ncbi:hypothetical protein LCGC14_1732790 [marine sediment metagenome]|uniref:Uncharacterized protein n=1 Tax=marine sediment metagenome TaxID=412755 RepID=A0A0F9H915_9ZZZZ